MGHTKLVGGGRKEGKRKKYPAIRIAEAQNSKDISGRDRCTVLPLQGHINEAMLLTQGLRHTCSRPREDDSCGNVSCVQWFRITQMMIFCLPSSAF